MLSIATRPDGDTISVSDGKLALEDCLKKPGNVVHVDLMDKTLKCVNDADKDKICDNANHKEGSFYKGDYEKCLSTLFVFGSGDTNSEGYSMKTCRFRKRSYGDACAWSQ